MATTLPHPYFGKTIARCTVADRLGRGATSAVFRAHYEPLHKDIALKILAPGKANEEMRTRFLHEARAIAKLDHENIVKVYDIVEDQGLLCILMELVKGETVQDLLDDQGALPPKKACRVAAQVARALEHAHEEKIVHRDIKPANFILDKNGETVKVVDFGLAAQHVANRVGTPLYMSPEAAQGKRIDEKSDIYALGVSLYQMLTGRHPFTGESVKEILAAQVQEEMVPPSKVRPQVGKKFDDVLRKMLVKSKGYRPSAGEVAEALEELGAEREEEGRKGGAKGRAPARAAKRKNLAPVIIAIAGGVAILAVALIFLLKSKDKETAEAPPIAPPTPAGRPDVTPVAPPPPPGSLPREDTAGRAVAEAEKGAAANPEGFDEAVRRWTAIEADYAGTEQANQAAVLRAKALEAKSAREAEAKAAADRKAAHEKQLEADMKAFAEIGEREKRFDFAGAMRLMEAMRSLPDGVQPAKWRRRTNRIAFLAEVFVKRVDEGLQGVRLLARDVSPEGSVVADVKGADAEGVLTDDGTMKKTIKWEAIPAEPFFDLLSRRVLSQRDVDHNVFLAVLAAELGLGRKAKTYYETAELVDQAGDVLERFKEFFVEKPKADEDPRAAK